jgi:hypothetical protein
MLGEASMIALSLFSAVDMGTPECVSETSEEA